MSEYPILTKKALAEHDHELLQRYAEYVDTLHSKCRVCPEGKTLECTCRCAHNMTELFEKGVKNDKG